MKINQSSPPGTSAYSIREKEISVWVSDCSAQSELKQQIGSQKAELEAETLLFFVSSPCVNYLSDAGAQTQVALELMNHFKTVLLNDEYNLD